MGKALSGCNDLMLGGPAYYLTGSTNEPRVVQGQVTWLGLLAVRVADPVGVRFLERKHVHPTADRALDSAPCCKYGSTKGATNKVPCWVCSEERSNHGVPQELRRD